MKQVKKMIKIELLVLKMNLQMVLEYRLNAVLIFWGGAFYNIGAILFLNFLFAKIPNVAGWDKWDMIFLYGIGQIFAYFYFFISFGIGALDKKINDGTFDFILTKPVNSLVFASLNYFSFESLIGLIQVPFIITYALANKHFEISFEGIIIAFFSLILTLIISHLLTLILSFASFWTPEARLHRLYRNTVDIAQYPYEIFKGQITRFIFFVIIPYALLINVPFRAIIGELDFRLFILQIIVCLGFIVTANFLWNFCLRRYSSASS